LDTGAGGVVTGVVVTGVAGLVAGTLPGVSVVVPVTGGVSTGGAGLVVGTLPVVSVVVPVTGGVVTAGGVVTTGVGSVTAGGVVTTGVVTTGVVGTTLESKSSDLDTGVGMTTGAGAAKVARHFISLLTSTVRGVWVLFPQSPLQPLKVIP
jgi:hypothetical protein